MSSICFFKTKRYKTCSCLFKHPVMSSVTCHHIVTLLLLLLLLVDNTKSESGWPEVFLSSEEYTTGAIFVSAQGHLEILSQSHSHLIHCYEKIHYSHFNDLCICLHLILQFHLNYQLLYSFAHFDKAKCVCYSVGVTQWMVLLIDLSALLFE